MKTLIIAASAALSMMPLAHAGEVWINEIHYDNDGVDIGEFVEIAGTAGIDIGGWSLVLYNGSKGADYATQGLSGALPDQDGTGYGALAFGFSGIQNGGADGVALVDAGGLVVQFLSYEGQLTATSGPALGMNSQDIGVFEPVDSPLGYSLQYTGIGLAPLDSIWVGALPETRGALNVGQVASPVPLPAALPMFAGALASLLAAGVGRRRQATASARG